MPTIQSYAAPSVYDPPMYSQAVKVTGTETCDNTASRS
jgi:hypothetical protein